MGDADDKVFVDCRSTRCRYTCAIYVERNADNEQIEVGDRIWWQGGLALWTPADDSCRRMTEPSAARTVRRNPVNVPPPATAGYARRRDYRTPHLG